MVAKPNEFENGNERSDNRYNNNVVPCSSKTNNCQQQKPKRSPLPIDRYKKHIIEVLKKLEDTVIFVGETASGKSTQIPQFCHEVDLSKNGLIAITQPRRVAAKTLSERVANEMGTEIGHLVGYKFRFESNLGEATRLLYQTEGMLLREALHDYRLRRYSTIIIDEVHERTINTDVLLYVLKQAQKDRKDAGCDPLRLILMSATMDLKQLRKYFRGAEVYYVRGRNHIVKLYYAPSLKANENDYLFNSISTVLQLHLSEPIDHGFLVFLTGQEEIESAIRVIKKAKKAEKKYTNISLFPLFAAVPANQQKQIFGTVPEGLRKVVFSTNIAETSITIPGIRVIIDSGKVKRRVFSAKDRIDVLQVANVSKAQAIQRAGRAGRDAPGKCYRLYSQEDYNKFEGVQTPELLRSNISWVLLCLINLGLTRLESLNKFLDPPTQEQLHSAVEELLMLNAISLERLNDQSTASITEEGQRLGEFPIEPCHAKILLEASSLGCLEEACVVVAYLSAEHVFNSNNQDLFCKMEDGKYGQEDVMDNCTIKFHSNDGDHVRFLRIWRAYSAITSLKTAKNNCDEFFQSCGVNKSRMESVEQIRKQLIKICREKKLQIRTCGDDFLPLRQAICKGLFQNTCVLDASTKFYVIERDRKVRVRIHPFSCLKNEKTPAFVFSQLVHTNEIYARDICPVQLDWVKSSKSPFSPGINRELERVRQLHLSRQSPCSSLSSSSSASKKRRKKMTASSSRGAEVNSRVPLSVKIEIEESKLQNIKKEVGGGGKVNKQLLGKNGGEAKLVNGKFKKGNDKEMVVAKLKVENEGEENGEEKGERKALLTQKNGNGKQVKRSNNEIVQQGVGFILAEMKRQEEGAGAGKTIPANRAPNRRAERRKRKANKTKIVDYSSSDEEEEEKVDGEEKEEEKNNGDDDNKML